MVQFNDYLDQIFSEFSKPEYSQIMGRAKVNFIDFAGSFDEGDLDVEMKWSQFRDWFLFVYVTDSNHTDLSPKKIMATESFREDVGIPRPIMDAIIDSHLSIFQHLKSYKDQIKVRDLLTGVKHYIFDLNVQLILERNDYFQARIFKYDNKYFFGGSLAIHPPAARKFIDTKIKILKKEKNIILRSEGETKFLENVFKMYYRALRFKLVEIQKIYSDQPLFERKTQVDI